MACVGGASYPGVRVSIATHLQVASRVPLHALDAPALQVRHLGATVRVPEVPAEQRSSPTPVASHHDCIKAHGMNWQARMAQSNGGTRVPVLCGISLPARAWPVAVTHLVANQRRGDRVEGLAVGPHACGLVLLVHTGPGAAGSCTIRQRATYPPRAPRSPLVLVGHVWSVGYAARRVGPVPRAQKVRQVQVLGRGSTTHACGWVGSVQHLWTMTAGHHNARTWYRVSESPMNARLSWCATQSCRPHRQDQGQPPPPPLTTA